MNHKARLHASGLGLLRTKVLSRENYLLAQDSRDTRHGFPLLEVQRLGRNVRQLLGGSIADQLHFTINDHFMGEVLPMCFARSRLPKTVTHCSMHAVMSSYTGVWKGSMFSSRCRSYKASNAAVDVE
jgi:hypothetical protein